MFKKSNKLVVSLISMALGSSCFVSARMSDSAGTVQQQQEMVNHFRNKIEKYVSRFKKDCLSDQINTTVDDFDKNTKINNGGVKFSNLLDAYKNYNLEKKL